MKALHLGKKTTENEFIGHVQKFLCANGYVRTEQCHFDGDSERRADVELALDTKHWPEGIPAHLCLEVKSHHSKDSPNTINKVFGQLLKETNKDIDQRQMKSCCLGVLIPTDGATWHDRSGTAVNRYSGIDYYRDGFQRIKQDVFSEFGRLVNARYVLAFSVFWNELLIYDWNAFYAGEAPIGTLGARPEVSQSNPLVNIHAVAAAEADH